MASEMEVLSGDEAIMRHYKKIEDDWKRELERIATPKKIQTISINDLTYPSTDVPMEILEMIYKPNQPRRHPLNQDLLDTYFKLLKVVMERPDLKEMMEKYKEYKKISEREWEYTMSKQPKRHYEIKTSISE